MLKINTYFHLRDPKAIKKTSILCLVSVGRERMKFSTGLSIACKDWNNSKQRSNDLKINRKITEIEERIGAYDTQCQLNNESPDFTVLGRCIKDENITNSKRENTNGRLFTKFIQEYFDTNKQLLAWNTVKKYETLKRFFEKTYPEITIDQIDSKFADTLRKVCLDKQELDNTISKRFQLIRTVLKWAEERGDIKDVNYKRLTHFQTDKIEAIALTKYEIEKVIKVDLSGRPGLERIRDVFIVACHTGIDFADLGKLNKGSLMITGSGNKYFSVIRQKTKKRQIVSRPPCPPTVEAILNKYDWNLPLISYDKSLQHLKEVCQIAKLDDLITLNSTSGSQVISETKPKYEWVGWKTARRSFITNALYDKKMDNVVASAVGHTKVATTAKYQHTSVDFMVDMMYDNN